LSGPIETYLREDHQRLERLRRSGEWWEFRGGLLRHIGLEERILLPDARRRRGGVPLPEAARLREDHGLLATLLVPPHSLPIAEAIERILAPHDALEEGPGGVYAQCDALAAGEAAAIVERLRAAPETPQRAHQDGPLVRAQVERALEVLAARGR
jgi:hypothetical protein